MYHNYTQRTPKRIKTILNSQNLITPRPEIRLKTCTACYTLATLVFIDYFTDVTLIVRSNGKVQRLFHGLVLLW